MRRFLPARTWLPISLIIRITLIDPGAEFLMFWILSPLGLILEKLNPMPPPPHEILYMSEMVLPILSTESSGSST